MLLAVETSCDETSVAVIHQGAVLSNVVSSQVQLHAEYGGVVPELATREHLSNLLPVTKDALNEAGISASSLDAVAATRGPGLPPALVVGWKTAQATAYVLNIPLIAVNHLEAHLYSPWSTGNPIAADYESFQPNISLIVSGGHTQLVCVRRFGDHTVLGGTLDDAAGECFDKTAKLLGLAYPGGPQIDRLAENGDPKRYEFPRPLLEKQNDNFSFSGLKTSVRYYLDNHPELKVENTELPHLCASIQAAIVDVLVQKTIRAACREGLSCVTASGGVTCNRALRSALTAACDDSGITLRLAPGTLCTDNAAMIGLLAEKKKKAGELPAEIHHDIIPSWSL